MTSQAEDTTIDTSAEDRPLSRPRFQKVRGVLVVDIEAPDVAAVAEDERLLQELIKAFKLRSRSVVVHSDSEIRERRGDKPLLLRKAKFRTS